MLRMFPATPDAQALGLKRQGRPSEQLFGPAGADVRASRQAPFGRLGGGMGCSLAPAVHEAAFE